MPDERPPHSHVVGSTPSLLTGTALHPPSRTGQWREWDQALAVRGKPVFRIFWLARMLVWLPKSVCITCVSGPTTNWSLLPWLLLIFFIGHIVHNSQPTLNIKILLKFTN